MADDELTEFYPLATRGDEPPAPVPPAAAAAAEPVPPLQDAPWATSRDHVALQFFWQGSDAFVTCKDSESVVPCFASAQCAASEFVQLVPVTEVRERQILDAMRVQLVSVDSDKYLRATHVSKYLKWSRTRDEQTVFVIQIADRKPLSASSRFTLTSCFWPERAVGFTQTFPLGGGRDVSKAIGFLTLEKRKKQAPLLFPIRFRAVLRAQRNERPLATAARLGRCTPLVTATDMQFIGDEDADSVSDVPLARVATGPEPDGQETVPSRSSSSSHYVGAGSDQDGWESCTFCGGRFRARSDLIAHIRDGHGEMLHRVSVPGTFCVDCGTRRVNGRCTRCRPDV
ncbi:unnamed protein product [Hyaloperonospora brassicae]|uniref:C2H2-type domain-containing protein n=1 Tax=Hyaloperonospora brassicae TaxID=162125 RepID=A0AAV0UQK8_HYABA|nr:unnamed protein product [Hyaloperonospora brassicae]